METSSIPAPARGDKIRADYARDMADAVNRAQPLDVSAPNSRIGPDGFAMGATWRNLPTGQRGPNRLWDCRVATDGSGAAKLHIWLGEVPENSVIVNNCPVTQVEYEGSAVSGAFSDDGWREIGELSSGENYVWLTIHPSAGQSAEPGEMLPESGDLVAEILVSSSDTDPYGSDYDSHTDAYPMATAPLLLAMIDTDADKPSGVTTQIQYHCGAVVVASISGDADSNQATMKSISFGGRDGDGAVKTDSTEQVGSAALFGFADPSEGHEIEPEDVDESVHFVVRKSSTGGAEVKYMTKENMDKYIVGDAENPDYLDLPPGSEESGPDGTTWEVGTGKTARVSLVTHVVYNETDHKIKYYKRPFTISPKGNVLAIGGEEVVEVTTAAEVSGAPV